MPKTIEVHITDTEIYINNPDRGPSYICERLRDAGIPVIQDEQGRMSIKSGTLTTEWSTYEYSGQKYIWEKEEQKEPK